MLRGDFGESLLSGKSIPELVGSYGLRSLVLAGTALLIAYGIAIPLGILSAVRHNSVWDQGSMFLANLGMGIPSFWLALLLILLFGATLHWLPIEGGGDVKHLVLPAFVLALESLAVTMRLMRSSMLEQLGQDYIRTLRAKGLKPRRIVWLHAARNALIPIISLTGLRIGWLIGYAVIVETVFRWPGLGYLLVDSVIRRDYPVAQGLALLLTLTVLWANLLANIGYAIIEPRSGTAEACRHRSRRRRVRPAGRPLARSDRRQHLAVGVEPADAHRHADHARARHARRLRALDRAARLRPAGPAELVRAAVHARASARHRPARTRHVQPAALRHPHLDLRRLRDHRDLAVLRRARRSDRRLLPRLDRHGVQRSDRRLLGLPADPRRGTARRRDGPRGTGADAGGRDHQLGGLCAHDARRGLSLREREFVEAARALGIGNLRIMARHIIPHAVPAALVLGSYYIALAIIFEAGFSSIGIGVQPPEPSLGAMIGKGRTTCSPTRG